MLRNKTVYSCVIIVIMYYHAIQHYVVLMFRFVFFLISGSSSGITEFQFKIISSNGQSIYYYYPFKSAHAKSFNSFYDDIGAAMSYATEAITSTATDGGSELKFKWLEAYKRDDQSAIDRNIADGKVTLKKRESKFREELERHEHEYIVYKDFT